MANDQDKNRDRNKDSAVEYVERGASPALIGGLVATVILLLLIVANTKTAEVNFIVAKPKVQLWVLVVSTMVFTLIAERLVGFAWRRRKKRRDQKN